MQEGTHHSVSEREPLRGDHWWSRVWWFYVDGFRSMTLGRTLWVIITIKVVVFFLILRWLFFPDFLATKADTDEGKADYVRQRLEKRDARCEMQDSRCEMQDSRCEMQDFRTALRHS